MRWYAGTLAERGLCPMASRTSHLLMVTTVSDTLWAFLLPYAAHYRQQGWRVDAATSLSERDRDERRLDAHFDSVHDIPWSRRPTDLRGGVGAGRRLRAILEGGGYDLVHTHTPIASFLTRLTCGTIPAPRRPRVVYTAHGFHFHPGGRATTNGAYALAEKAAGRWCDRLVVINEDDLHAARWLQLAAGQVTLFPGIGVDLDRYRPTPELRAEARAFRSGLGLEDDAVVFTMVAELIHRKNHRAALVALARAGDRRHHLVLAGDGPLGAELAAEAHRLGIGDRVHLTGLLDDVRPAILASAATVLPSRQEGLPRSVLESLALGVPVIGSDIRGIAELVGDDGGILVGVEDIDGLAAAFAAMARDDRRPGLPPSVDERLARYSQRHLLELHDRLYHELLSDEAVTA
jgi:glycosyltransferase involved in cell wall biosynthesis